MAIPSELGLLLPSKDSIKIVAFTELIRHYLAYGLREVYIDGEISDFVIEEVRKQLSVIPTIKYGADADRSVKIVNIADAVAYRLFTYYTETIGNNHSRYSQFEITPNQSECTALIKHPSLEARVTEKVLVG